MKLILLIINQVISYVLLVYGAFYIVSGAVGVVLGKKAKKLKKAKKENKFAIIIPARNEEIVIGNLVDSLVKQNYKKDNYDIYVVVNNTTDNTKEEAKKHGAHVFDCKEPVKVKADVLSYAFNKLKSKKDIDAYIIFDADNIVHPDFLKEMNIVLENGYRVAQGFRDAKNPSDSWISGSYAIFYYIQNIFFNKARMVLNSNSTINGTGFMVKKEIIDQDGFKTFTLTEDMEFSGQCALKDERIYFADKAIIYDEYPVDFKTSWKQRSRWSAGNFQCLKIYSLKLFKAFFKTGQLYDLDMCFNFTGTFMHVVAYFNIFIFRIYNLIQGYGLAMNDIISHFETYLFQVIIAFISLKMLHKPIKPFIKGILLFPIWILSWLPINAIYLFKKYKNWEEIKHSRSISLEEINQ